ncbi:MAG: hypothetical protein ABR583_12075 [Gaiellaceae bacterium]
MTARPAGPAPPPRRRTAPIAPPRNELVPVAVLGIAMLIAFVLLYRKGFGLTFYYDEWNFVMNRRGWSLGTFLEPHNEHLVLIPVIVFKFLFVTVGLDAYWAYRAVVLLVHLACAGLVFVLLRRRLDPYLALAAALAILFLGSAWQNLLWPFQMGYLMSIAAGLGMLLALDSRRDAVASIMLGASLASGSVGLPFAAAALVAVARPVDRRRRLWVPLVPVGLYVIWALLYGNPDAAPGAESGLWPLFSNNIPAVPGYVANAAAGAVGALIGLGVDWGRPLVLVAAVALAVRLVRDVPVSVRLVSLLAAAAVYWGLAALFRAQLNTPAESRYLYFGAVIVLLIAAELLGSARLTVRGGAVLTVLLAISFVANFGTLQAGSKTLQETSSYVAAELGAFELVGRGVDTNYAPDPVRAPDITAGRYFDAIDQYGSPADTPQEIAERSEPYRQAADAVLVQALKIAPQTAQKAVGDRPFVETAVGGTVTPRKSCVDFRPNGAGPTLDIRVPSSGVVVTTHGASGVELRLRAFAETFPTTAFVALPARSTQSIALPRPRGIPDWHVRLTPPEPVSVCGLP